MSNPNLISFEPSPDIFEDLDKVAVELNLEVAVVVCSLVEHLVKEMGTDIIAEGVRLDWDFAGEDLDEAEPASDDPDRWLEED